jgi:hypothetical protein
VAFNDAQKDMLDDYSPQGYQKQVTSYKRCYEDHPALPLKDGLVIYGGSCISPIVKDADVYVGFDMGMKSSIRSYPWEQGEEFLFHIVDMSVPKDHEQTFKLVDFTIKALQDGKKVHMGCIGGHGRTGLIFAALVKTMLGEKDAIEYVRKNYCKKAVETKEQVNWLAKHFGITPVEGSKEGAFYSGSSNTSTSTSSTEKWWGAGYGVAKRHSGTVAMAEAKSVQLVRYLQNSDHVWG